MCLWLKQSKNGQNWEIRTTTIIAKGSMMPLPPAVRTNWQSAKPQMIRTTLSTTSSELILMGYHSHQQYVFFSGSGDTFIKTNSTLAHKTSLNKFKGMEILQSISLNTMKLSWKSITIIYLGKHPKYLNNTLLDNSPAKDEIKGEMRPRSHTVSQRVGRS